MSVKVRTMQLRGGAHMLFKDFKGLLSFLVQTNFFLFLIVSVIGEAKA